MKNFRNFRCKIRPEDGFSCENDIILVHFTHLFNRIPYIGDREQSDNYWVHCSHKIVGAHVSVNVSVNLYIAHNREAASAPVPTYFTPRRVIGYTYSRLLSNHSHRIHIFTETQSSQVQAALVNHRL